jgi:hypothetical protein
VLRLLNVFLFGVLLSLAQTGYSSVSDGLTWLTGEQQADGSIQRDPALVHPLRSTAETALAFDLAGGVVSLSREQALAYLQANTDLSTEFIARALMLGIQVDGAGESLIDRLISHQSSDGGFGSYAGYDSNVLDTSLALSALVATKTDHVQLIGGAISYMTSAQANDGSFTLPPSELPSLPLTALTSIALQNYTFDYSGVSGAVSAASDYLLDNQVVDPGLENNWQAAISLLAVIPVIRDSALYASSVSQLTTDQQADGSWGQDVFTTALAVRALELAANITFPEDPTTGSFSGQILDSGTSVPLSNVTIFLAETPDLNTTSDDQGRFALGEVAPGSYTVTYQVAGYNGATQAASAVVGQIANLGEIRLQRLPDTGIIMGGVSDAVSGAALPTASIVFTSADDSVTVPIQSDGSYQVALAPASYTFVVSASGYQMLTGTATVNAGNNLSFSPVLYPDNETPVDVPVSLLGKVVDAETGAAITGASVQVQSTAAQTTTDGSGQFSIGDLTEGEIAFVVSAQDYVSQQLSVVAPPNVNVDVGTIALVGDEPTDPTLSQVFGAIVNSETGSPVAGATVLLEQSGDSVVSTSAGEYNLSDIDTLTFSLFISAPGYWSQWASFTFTEHGSVQHNVALTPSDLGGFAIDQLQTDQAVYPAYSQVMISADVVNDGDVPRNAKLFLEVRGSNGNLITGVPVNTMTGGVGPGDAITVLPGDSIPVNAQWYTGITTPGSYIVKLSAFDEFTNQLLSEEVSYIDIAETAQLESLVLRVNKSFSSVGLNENILLTLDAVNRSNVPISFTLTAEWRDPVGLEVRSVEVEINLQPEETTKSIQLDEFLHTFNVSGVYPFSGQLTNSQLSTTVQGVSISIAPTVRVEASQSATPNTLVPDGDKRLTIGIEIEGVEQ